MGKIYLFNLFAESHENFFEITDRTRNYLKKKTFVTHVDRTPPIHTPFKTQNAYPVQRHNKKKAKY